MSLIDRFYEEYENLTKRYGGVSRFYQRLGDQRVRGYINRSRRDGTMPPPTQLKRFEDYAGRISYQASTKRTKKET